MSRLIDANAVINVLKETGIIQDNDLGHLVVDEIERIPTAYDTEAVVAKLEKRKDRQKRSFDCEKLNYQDKVFVAGKIDAYIDAIKIVRKGRAE